jgi:GTP cyclohydrolase FolE2
MSRNPAVLEDVQNIADIRQIPIDKVGIKDQQKPALSPSFTVLI